VWCFNCLASRKVGAIRQFEAQIERWMFQHWDGEGESFYRFHFTIEQAFYTGEVEEETGKVLNNHLQNPCLVLFEQTRSCCSMVICPASTVTSDRDGVA
jgi:hypothetical protein